MKLSIEMEKYRYEKKIIDKRRRWKLPTFFPISACISLSNNKKNVPSVKSFVIDKKNGKFNWKLQFLKAIHHWIGAFWTLANDPKNLLKIRSNFLIKKLSLSNRKSLNFLHQKFDMIFCISCHRVSFSLLLCCLSHIKTNCQLCLQKISSSLSLLS